MQASSHDIRDLGFKLARSVTTHPDSAKELLEDYLEIMGPTPGPAANALYNLAKALVSFRTSDSLGLTFAMRAYELARSTGDAEIMIQSVTALGTYHFTKQEYEEALDYFLDAEGYLTPEVSGRMRFITFYNIGETYRVQSDFEKALAYFKNADDIVSPDITHTHRANLYNNIGNLYAHISVSAEALLFFNKAAEYARKAGNDVDLARAATNSADTYVRLGAYKEATAMAQLALSLKERVGDQVGKGYAFMTLAKMHMQKNDFVQAHSLLDQAQYVFDKEVGINNRKASCTYLRGEVLLKEDRLDEALEKFKLAESMQAVTNNKLWILQCRLGQARVWKAKGDVHRAEVILRRHVSSASDSKSLEINSIVSREVADLHEASLDYKKAFASLRNYNKLQHDSFLRDAGYVDTSRNSILKIARMERSINAEQYNWMLPFESGSIDVAVDRAFQGFPLPFWITREHKDTLVFAFANAAFEKATGLPRKRIIGKPLGRVVPSNIIPRLMRHARYALQTKSTKTAHERIATPAGARDYKTILIPFEDKDTAYLLCVAEDITEQKNKQRAANRSLQMRLQDVKNTQQFVGGISHEIRTHITTLLGYSDLHDEHDVLQSAAKNINRYGTEVLNLVQALSMLADDRRSTVTQVAEKFMAVETLRDELNSHIISQRLSITQSGHDDISLYNFEVEYRKAISLFTRAMGINGDKVLIDIIPNEEDVVIHISSDWSNTKNGIAKAITLHMGKLLERIAGSVSLQSDKNSLTFILKFCSIDNVCFQ